MVARAFLEPDFGLVHVIVPWWPAVCNGVGAVSVHAGETKKQCKTCNLSAFLELDFGLVFLRLCHGGCWAQWRWCWCRHLLRALLLDGDCDEQYIATVTSHLGHFLEPDVGPIVGISIGLSMAGVGNGVGAERHLPGQKNMDTDACSLGAFLEPDVGLIFGISLGLSMTGVGNGVGAGMHMLRPQEEQGLRRTRHGCSNK